MISPQLLGIHYHLTAGLAELKTSRRHSSQLAGGLAVVRQSAAPAFAISYNGLILEAAAKSAISHAVVAKRWTAHHAIRPLHHFP